MAMTGSPIGCPAGERATPPPGSPGRCGGSSEALCAEVAPGDQAGPAGVGTPGGRRSPSPGPPHASVPNTNKLACLCTEQGRRGGRAQRGGAHQTVAIAEG